MHEEGEEVGEVGVGEPGFDAIGHERAGGAVEGGDFGAWERGFGAAGETERDTGGVVAEEDA